MAGETPFEDGWDDSLLRGAPPAPKPGAAVPEWPTVLDVSSGAFLAEDGSPGALPPAPWSADAEDEQPAWRAGAVALTDTPDGVVVSVIFGGQALPTALLPGCSAGEFEEAGWLDR